MRNGRTIALLAAAGFLAAALPAAAQQNFITYHCADGTEIATGFYRGDSRIHIQLDGKALALPKRLSLSGTRFAKGSVTLTIAKDGQTATLKRGRVATACALAH